ncbi:MAG TPA: chemotaxis protein CheW [Candidatus Paceibacterota bacterium]
MVVLGLDDGWYALRLAAVQRVVRAVEVTPLPKAPLIVLGVINVQGQIIPVFNLRERFSLKQREIEPSNQFIIATTRTRVVALVVDTVVGVIERLENEILAPASILSDMEYVEGVTKFEDGIVFIHDLGGFLSLDEANQLDQALKNSQDGADHV